MTPQELKNSILQLAIQGKLVEQRADEGTGAELLEEILAAKNAESAKGKGEKSHAKSAKSAKVGSCVSRDKIPDDEKPFDIPENWEWVRLGDIVIKDIKRGKSPTYTQKSGTLVFAQKCNTKAGVINLSLALFLDEAKLSKYPKSEFMRDGDIVINSTGNGTLGRVGIYHDSNNPNKLPVVPDSHVTVVRVGEKVSVEYVFYGLKHYQPLLEKLCSGSTNQTELSASTVKSLVFPLPPLSEQKRIVAKIEELLPLIDRYEKAWSKLDDFNKRFPVDMQKSLLQMAIQGKLVEQRAEEGTAAELLEKIFAVKDAKKNLTRSRGVRGGCEEGELFNLPKAAKSHPEKFSALSASPRDKIPDDEKPFDIPESWEWVRLGEVVDVRDGTHDTPKYVQAGVPLVTSKNLVSGTIDFTTAKFISYEDSKAINIRSGVDDGDVLFAMIGTIGNPVLIRKDREFSIKNMALFKPIDRGLFCMEYLMMFLTKAQLDMRKSASASVQSFVSLSFLRNYPIPLPPLAEQKRIVAKLEELLPLCERLKAKSGELSQPELSKRSEV